MVAGLCIYMALGEDTLAYHGVCYDQNSSSRITLDQDVLPERVTAADISFGCGISHPIAIWLNQSQGIAVPSLEIFRANKDPSVSGLSSICLILRAFSFVL